MTNNHDQPPGTYELKASCFNCGQEFTTYTEANMSDPEQAAIVRRMTVMILCDACHNRAKAIKGRDFTRGVRCG